MELQVKLLRVLETGRFMRVGSTTTLDADVRVIAASNRPLLQAVQAGKLREDLLYRLNVFPIEMPPLRDRLDDVPLLADHFLRQIAAKEGKNKRFTAKALAQLQTYHWPGNVRELRNAVQRAYVMAAGEVVDEQWLPKGEGAEPQSTAASSAASTTIAAPAAPAAPAASGTGYAAHGTAGAPPASESSGPSVTMPLGSSMAQVEKAFILATLQHYKHHKEQTAAVLGISLKTLYNRLKEYAAEDAAAADKAAQ